MLEQYYGHSTNVGIVEELTKPKTKRVPKTIEEGGSALGWLGGKK